MSRGPVRLTKALHRDIKTKAPADLTREIYFLALSSGLTFGLIVVR